MRGIVPEYNHSMAMISCRDSFDAVCEFDEREFVDRESVYGILQRDGCILLVQDSVSGFWDFPGGGVELGESLPQALQREFAEETGIRQLSVVRKVTSTLEYFFHVASQKPWRSHRHFYLVTAPKNARLAQTGAEDICGARFISRTEVDSFKIRARTKELLQKLG